MFANEKAMGRNWYTADSCKLVEGGNKYLSDTWARWELHWNDGAMVCCTEDSREEAVTALVRYGFNAK